MKTIKFKENLKQLLLEKNMTQKELSSRTGIPTSSIASWFGKRSSYPSIENANLIADELDCSVDYLIGRESDDGIIIINKDESLTASEQSILNIFNQLTTRRQTMAIGYLSGLLDEQRQHA